ncbi:MAG: tetratricopeptide repeat protein [Deltaproteobacteria bacterium]|nr:tetratricopeptide repeat protein [Deltaproteobacteria bacterium]
MHARKFLLLLSLVLWIPGCMSLKGERLLKNEQYQDGVATFKNILQEEPQNPQAHYYLGRFYLALERPEEALPHLKQAVQGDPEQGDYHFWLGVAYWAMRDFKLERKSYLQALAKDPKHVPARLYLAHTFLDSGDWQEALDNYDLVLRQAPYNPEALYNRGLALIELKRPKEEAKAWKRYLQYYPEGKWALRAVEHLNGLGDFSYRNFTIGYRRVTLEPITFRAGTATLLSQGKPSLQVLGTILSINHKIWLEIACYKSGYSALAAARAEAVRDYLLQEFPQIEPPRLGARGIGRKEKIKTGNKVYLLDDSTTFITTRK